MRMRRRSVAEIQPKPKFCPGKALSGQMLQGKRIFQPRWYVPVIIAAWKYCVENHAQHTCIARLDHLSRASNTDWARASGCQCLCLRWPRIPLHRAKPDRCHGPRRKLGCHEHWNEIFLYHDDWKISNLQPVSCNGVRACVIRTDGENTTSEILVPAKLVGHGLRCEYSPRAAAWEGVGYITIGDGFDILSIPEIVLLSDPSVGCAIQWWPSLDDDVRLYPNSLNTTCGSCEIGGK